MASLYTPATSINKGVQSIRNPLSHLTVQYEGEWQKFDKLMTYLAGSSQFQGIRRDIAKSQRDFLTKLKLNLVLGLQSEGVAIGRKFAPHSPNYKGAKSIGVRDGHYLNALQGAEIIQKNYEVQLRLTKGSVSYRPKKGRQTVGEYALTFERGTKKRPTVQPARPLWAQGFAYTGGKNGVLNNMIGAIGKRLSKMGIKIRHNDYTYIK